jgi:hypothetical protein
MLTEDGNKQSEKITKANKQKKKTEEIRRQNY